MALRLSIASRAITRGYVPSPIAPSLDRLISVLCVALMMLYAATLPAKAADQLQHAPALMITHEHAGFDNFSVDAVHASHDDHADHHDDAPDSGDQSSDSLIDDHHHHHGDGGSNLLVPNAAAAPTTDLLAAPHGIDKDRQIVGLRSIEPERPPRTILLNA